MAQQHGERVQRIPLLGLTLFALVLGCSRKPRDYECSDWIADVARCPKWVKLPGYTEDVTVESDGSVTTLSGPVALTRCRDAIEVFCGTVLR